MSSPQTVVILPNYHIAQRRYLLPRCPILALQKLILESGDVCLATDSQELEQFTFAVAGLGGAVWRRVYDPPGRVKDPSPHKHFDAAVPRRAGTLWLRALNRYSFTNPETAITGRSLKIHFVTGSNSFVS